MVPSSSGLGRLVLIQKIAGSTPAGITKLGKLSARFMGHKTRFFVTTNNLRYRYCLGERR